MRRSHRRKTKTLHHPGRGEPGAVRNHGPLVFLKVHLQKAAGGAGQLAERPKQGTGVRPSYQTEAFTATNAQAEHKAKGANIEQNSQSLWINRHRKHLNKPFSAGKNGPE